MKRKSGLISRAGGVAGLVNQYTGHNMIFPGHIDYTARTSAPPGWLPCDGRALSRTVYASLFAAIGITYGAGDGSTTFNVPDDRGEFLRGADMGRGIDAGRVLGSLQTGQNASHTHTGVAVSGGGHTHTIPGLPTGGTGAYGGSSYQTGSQNTGSSGNHTHTLTIDAAGGNEARPRNRAYLAIIKY